MKNSNLRRVVERYVTLTTWFFLHQDEKSIKSKHFELVLNQIGTIENELAKYGVSQQGIERLIDYSENFAKTPLSKLSKQAQLRLCKLIFGAGTHWDDGGGKDD